MTEFNLPKDKDHLGLLLKIQRLKGLLLKGSNSIKGPNSKGFPADKEVSRSYIFHNLIRGFYKPSGMEYILSCQLTEKEENYGKEIEWDENKPKDFKLIRLAPPNRPNDPSAQRDIISLRNNLRDKIPIGIFLLKKRAENFALGLGIPTEETEDGKFLIKPIQIMLPINTKPWNLIVYGAPGTGKSYWLNEEAKIYFASENLFYRITFHPSYSYREFFGCYKPKPIYKKNGSKQIFKPDRVSLHEHQMEPMIEYIFEPGVLLNLLIKALLNPHSNYLLIIEEINRANAASVFGNILQLLDRQQAGPEAGWSVYPIIPEPEVQDYLKSFGGKIKSDELRLPPNLYLWATMNNADQGVMPLDSAFKRRWNFRYMGINENQGKNELDKAEIKLSFAKNPVKWNDFRNQINKRLESLGIHEDKFIGPFFLSKKELQDAEAIKNKLLLYLKEDVLKYKSGLFQSDLKSFSSIVEKYDKKESVFDSSIVL